MKLKHFCWLTLSLSILVIQSLPAQTKTKAPALSLPSAQEWQFHKYGNTPVNHYTGTASVSIPIYTYKDNDFEIPIALNYASNGYMANIPTDILGLGWYLSGTGDITRTINGIEDDYNIDPDGHPGSVGRYGTMHLLFEPNGIKQNDLEQLLQYNYDNSDGVSGITGEDGRAPWLKYSSSLLLNECRPDTYFFKFPEHSGTFQFAPLLGQAYRVYDTNHPYGEYKITFFRDLMGTTDYPNRHTIRSFDITTGDGYIYTFGKRSSEMKGHSVLPQNVNGAIQNGNYTIYGTWSRAKTSWPLTSIIAANGRQVIYEYEGDTSLDNKEIEAYYSSLIIKPDYDSRFSDRARDPINGGYDFVNFLDVYGSEKQIEHRAYARIKSINIDNKIVIEFKYVVKKKELCVFGGKNTELHNRGLVSEISINRINSDETTTNLRTCKLEYVFGNKNPVAMLKSVEVSGEGKYEMAYYNETSDFPLHNDGIADPWGFYNEGNGNIATPNSALKGMLQQIVYPTGGYTTYEYEGHKFAYSVAKYTDKRKETFLTPTTPAYAGGLRIKMITDYSAQGVVASQRRFEYELNGQGTGISLAYPRYILRGTEKSYNIGLATPVLDAARISYSFDKTHIEYSSVTEKQRDGSKKILYFSSYHDTPDENYVSRSVTGGLQPESASTRIATVDADDRNPISMQTQRGKLLRAEYYDAEGELVFSENNTYDKSKTLLKNPSVEFNESGTYVKKFVVDDYPLISTRKVYYNDNDSLVMEKSYHYNDRGQIVETRMPDGRGNTIVSKVQYVVDVPNPDTTFIRIKNRNILSCPYKKQVTLRKSDSSEILLLGERYDYYDFFVHFRNTPFPIEKINSTTLSENVPWNSLLDFNFEEYLEPGDTYQYDWFGNIVQISDQKGVPTSFIWGHKGQYLVAKVVGASLEQLKNVKGLGYTNHFVEGNLAEDEIDALYALENVQVTVYDYDPYVGITRVIDPSGRQSHYRYDSNGKLIQVKDDKNILMEQYDYNIKNK